MYVASPSTSHDPLQPLPVNQRTVRHAPLEAWYTPLPARAVGSGKTKPVFLHGDALFVCRARDGALSAFADRCPHRGARLSDGACEGDEVVCPFHGWRFSLRDGSLSAAPAVAPDLPEKRPRLLSRPVREAFGRIWIYTGTGDPDRASPILEAPSLDPTRGPAVTAVVPVSADYDLCAMSFFDPAHVPFVHTSAWFGRNGKSPKLKAKTFVPRPWGFTMRADDSGLAMPAGIYRLLGAAPDIEIAYLLPATRIETIRAGRRVIVNVTTAIPRAVGQCDLVNLIYGNVPGLSFAAPVAERLGRRFLDQDRVVLESAQAGRRQGGGMMFIGDADVPAQWILRSLKAYEAAMRDRTPFKNPAQERILYWRT